MRVSFKETGQEMSDGKPDVKKAALEMLRSQDFFAQLRGTLARLGLAGEEKFGMIVYFVMISRFRPNPLRVALLETTDGGAEYVVRCVSRLFEPGTICGVCPEHRWLRFAGNPNHRVAYVRHWSDGLREGIRFEIDGNKLSRVSRRERDGRILAIPDTVDGSFACIAEKYPWESFDRSRWLTVELPTPPISVRTELKVLSDDEVATWKEAQCYTWSAEHAPGRVRRSRHHKSAATECVQGGPLVSVSREDSQPGVSRGSGICSSQSGHWQGGALYPA